MKLLSLNYRYSFGHDWYVQILKSKKYSLLQFSISWNDTPGWPYLQISFGSNGFFSLMFWVYKFGFDLDIFSRTWKFQHLNNIKNSL